MNTNHLKKFAQEARRKLLEQVGAKLNFVLTTDSAELREKTEQLKQLRQELGRTTKEQLIEKVAYTWFNRLMALRFMDLNDYQPLGIRIITPKDGYTIPELLDEAKRGNIPEELKVNRQKIYDLLDNKIPSTNPQNEAYKELLIATCNHLHTTFPFLFEKINDYTELLLPDDLTSDFSILKDVRNGMPLEDCKNVEIIGWLYQFYISEKKDEVFASKSKVKKEDIPAATQLFTPRWIVEYMVQNTLGKLWLQNRPKSRLREHMQYFFESASLEAKDYLKINSPEEIKFLDPASGSGHILVYAFELLIKIYEEEGYNISEIPQLIIENNLYGFEIDERAAQLSGLALMIKAREYHRRVFHKGLKPNILCFHDLHVSKVEIKDLSKSAQIQVSDELMHDFLLMQQASNFGSLILPHAHTNEIEHVLNKFYQFLPNADVFQRSNVEALIGSLNQLHWLGQKLHCVVTNPPYMGGGNINEDLAEFVTCNYPHSKADLMACFIESGLAMLKTKGFMGMINQHSWMFIGSYELLRRKLIKSIFWDTLLHLGARTFPEIGGEVVQNVTFTVWKETYNSLGTFIRLVDFNDSYEKERKTLELVKIPDSRYLFKINQQNFDKIPTSTIGYWISNKSLECFSQFNSLSNIAAPSAGLQTGNNIRFLRFFFEVNYKKISSTQRYVRYNKAGGNRKWYGLDEYIIIWENNAEELKQTGRAVFRNSDKYFKESISWGLIATGQLNTRYYTNAFVFDNGAPSLIIQNNLKYFLGLLNSKVTTYFLALINPTLNAQVGNISGIPVSIMHESEIDNLVDEIIEISKCDWNTHETSFSFSINELIRINGFDLLIAFENYQQYWKNKFFQLHKNEEEINNLIIGIYGLNEELTPTIPLEEITIQQDELDRPALAKLNKKLFRDSKTLQVENYNEITLPFVSSEIMAQFISYSVGCMFGRYSLDKKGLILANQGETLADYLHKIEKTKNECNFLPDEDNIIPILDGDWFEDDIVGRFYHFLKVTYGEKNFNKNLSFIVEQIGKEIRKYFLKDFYHDHIKRYKKRPIYWMFSSPKGSFNVLIYMHRYTPDTGSNILNKYLKEFIGKLNTRKEHLVRVMETGSASDKSKAIKESDNIQKMLVELHEYERDILYPLATERMEIDLDDGVLVNYNKFGKAVKEVNGLNDPATKKKVKQFDWIDTSQIR